MGVSYLVAALSPKWSASLAELGVRLPSVLPPSRLPTRSELERVLGELQEFKATSTTLNRSRSSSVDFEIVHLSGYDPGPSTTIWAHHASERTKPPGANDPVDVVFHRGDPELNLRILKELTRICGPLIFMVDYDIRPIIVTPDTDIASARRHLADPNSVFEWEPDRMRTRDPNPFS